MVPILGQDVFYHTAPDEKGEVFPAKVTRLHNDDGVINLTVFLDYAAPETRRAVPHGPDIEGRAFWSTNVIQRRQPDISPDPAPEGTADEVVDTDVVPPDKDGSPPDSEPPTDTPQPEAEVE